eukprot:346-Amphidinium_carterae.1
MASRQSGSRAWATRYVHASCVLHKSLCQSTVSGYSVGAVMHSFTPSRAPRIELHTMFVATPLPA